MIWKFSLSDETPYCAPMVPWSDIIEGQLILQGWQDGANPSSGPTSDQTLPWNQYDIGNLFLGCEVHWGKAFVEHKDEEKEEEKEKEEQLGTHSGERRLSEFLCLLRRPQSSTHNIR